MAPRRRLLVGAVVAAAVVAAGLPYASPAAADTHSAVRSFDALETFTGGEVTVTIEVSNFGPFARVSETLPDGWAYTGSSLPDSAVSVEGSVVRFILLDEGEFTYTATAPDAVGTFAFSGVIENAQRQARTVDGADEISVRIDEALLEEIAARDSLISQQQALLNSYRCRFDVDAQLVAGGCEDGLPLQRVEGLPLFTGSPASPTQWKPLVAAQEALLNAYRCQFDADIPLENGWCVWGTFVALLPIHPRLHPRLSKYSTLAMR